MTRFKIKNLKFKILFLLFTVNGLRFTTLIIAQSPIPTSTTEGKVDEIQQIREAVQQKVKEKISDIVKPTTIRKAIIGTVSAITSNNQITITYQNKDITANIDPEVVYIDAKKNKSKITNLKTGQEVLILGNYQTETDLFTVKRIIAIKLATDILPAPITVIGQIVDTSKTSNVFSLIPTKNKNQQLQIFYTDKTKITLLSGETVKSEDIKNGQKVIVVLIPKDNKANNFTAIRLMLQNPQITP
ncbi:MAG: hypothetical protein WCV93_03670 [Candidatus Shapirobacteria bacterium]